MIYIFQNLLAILAATGAGLALGLIAVRLSKGLLPKPGSLVVVALAEFWLASILAGALILAPPEAPALVMALATPVVICIGFIVPVIAVLGAVGEISTRSCLLTGVHWLVVMLVMAGTLEWVGLTAPPGAV
ncbi:MAG: hypothetical protein V2J14_09625 [Erythrobacter sp.]|nr:hypothetical protein [Erythrobacter sp.]